ncbi:cytochrome P450 [Curtobacterium sp. Leaf261]|uniref:cytochrome P450 n=1 Tax=Curtobacterium sp. Leaf261 TaxID=1736311 RepID=UPI0007002753|nr:cytochrome P450 [Curtobacterium sp. Leaf261]KQO59719.1 cytochrome [Curtobacterium sp. Leaf261]
MTIDSAPADRATTDPRDIDLMDLRAFTEDRDMAVFRELREHDPVHWNAPSERGPGFWALTTYADVKAAASDTDRLTAAEGTQILDRKVEGALQSLHNMDGQEHVALRRVTIPHLRAVKIQRWMAMIEESVTLLLDDAERLGSFDLVETVSARLPMLVLSRVLGVPAADAPRMVDWTNRLTSSDPDGVVDAAALAEARDELMGYFQHLTDTRRADPQDDLISVMANGAVRGEPLTWNQLAAYYILLVAAGNETTRHLVSGGTVALDEHDAWGRLAADRSLLAPTVEEMFRHVSPVAAMRRTATMDLSIGGRDITAGEKVVLWFSAANRDPAMFEDPETFRLDRTPNEHLSFGWGAHFCLGSHLARAEVRSFFRAVLDRGIRLSLDGAPERLRVNLFRGWDRVPVRVVGA